MENHNDKKIRFRKQDLFAASAAIVFGVAAALSPQERDLPLWIQAALIGASACLLGWLFFRLFAPGLLQERGGRAVLSLLFCIHLVSTLFFFGPRDVLNERPVLTIDHAFHYYQVMRANSIFPRSGRLHTYDPYFMAGYPGGALFDLDTKGAELFCSPFRPEDVARALKAFILLSYLSIVFTVYKGSRLLGAGVEAAVLGVALFLFYWHWGRPFASHFRYVGMFAFVFVSHLSLLTLALFREFLRGRAAWAFLAAGPVTFLVHPTAAVLLPVPFVILLIKYRAALNFRRVAVFVLWCAAVLLANAIWLVPMFRYLEFKTPSDAYFQVAGLKGIFDLLKPPSCLPAVVLIGISIPGAWWGARLGEARDLRVPFWGGVCLLAIAAYGIYLPGLRHLEPGRFLLSALVLLAPAAGSGFAWGAGLVGRTLEGRWRTGAVRRGALALLCVSPLFLSLFATRTQYRHRLSTTPPPAVARLIEAVKEFADPTGRLMIEDGPALLYGNVHLPGVLPQFTGVEQIGGPYPYTFLTHHFATFERDRTMGRPLSEVEPDRFLEYLDLYNIRWIVTASDEARETIEALGAAAAGKARPGPALERAWQDGRYALWRVGGAASFVRGGEARLRAAYGQITVDFEDPPAEVILKYHWDKGLRVDPPARIAPTLQLDDPVPFVRLAPNGVVQVVIRF